MQGDFHYYATYCAAYIAGYSHEESLAICYSAQFVDWCTATLLETVKGPAIAATTQSQLELADSRMDIIGLQNMTRIWASFHFLPKDLYAEKKGCGKRYMQKYRLICGPNSDLVRKTVELAKGKDLQAVGVAMHVLADTWAHSNFAGTPSQVINNTNYHFYELLPEHSELAEKLAEESSAAGAAVVNAAATAGTAAAGAVAAEESAATLASGKRLTRKEKRQQKKDARVARKNGLSALVPPNPALPEIRGFVQRLVNFVHNPGSPDDIEKGVFTNTVNQGSELTIMNLGHGRAGHLPDYSFIRYRYLPAWGDYQEIIKDNPSDYIHAFCQMVYAMRYLRGEEPEFVTERYDWETIAPWWSEMRAIIEKRQPDASEDWKRLGQTLSGHEVEDFVVEKFHREYTEAEPSNREETFLGKFFNAAIAHKSMVTHEIYSSGNRLAGFSVEKKRKEARP